MSKPISERAENAKARWCAELITSSERLAEVDITSADKIYVTEYDVGDGKTPIASSETTEPKLLRALIKLLPKNF